MRRWTGCLILAAGLACTGQLGPGSTEAEPTIVLVLVAGESRHRMVATWAIPADSLPATFPDARPVTADDLHLEVTGPGGLRAAPLGDPDSAGVFHVDLPVLPGAEYRLAGRVGGVLVSGRTTVPGPIDLIEPGSDTLRASGASQFLEIRYHVRSSGAAAVAFSTAGEGFVLFVGDTIDMWRGPAFFLGRGANPIFVDVYDAAGAAFLFRRDWSTNLEGAVGVMAGRTRRPLTVVIE